MGNIKRRKIQFSPSLMCMDFLKIEEQLTLLNEKADIYHVDIMDGHYVKNFSLSPIFIEQIHKKATLPIDAHLMVQYPSDFIDMLIKAGANYITVHSDTIIKDAFRVMNKIKDLGCKTGVALNPANSLDEIKYYIDILDKVTLMTVDAGFAGQKFIPQMLSKINELIKIREIKGLNFLIEVDGSCNEHTFKQLYETGVDVLIVGSSGLFNLDSDISVAWNKMMDIFNRCIG